MSIKNANFPEAIEDLILSVESQLYALVKTPMTREQAICLKEAFQRPLGVLNSIYKLQSNSVRRRKKSSFRNFDKLAK